MDSWFSMLSSGLEPITVIYFDVYTIPDWANLAGFWVLSSHPHYFLVFWDHKIAQANFTIYLPQAWNQPFLKEPWVSRK